MELKLVQSLLVLSALALIFSTVGCIRQQDTTPEGSTTAPPVATTLGAAAEVEITSFTCSLTDVINDGGIKEEHVQATVRGTAQGPVKSRLELPALIWSTDAWDCGAWTHTIGALVAVGHTCVREEGQPQSTNWSVTAASDYGGWLRGKSRSYGAKIYLGSDLMPQKEDGGDAVCQ